MTKTIEDFKPAMNAKHIVERGEFGEGNLNYSAILTKLIQEAGRWCRTYASDLFIFWEGIDNALKSGILYNSTRLFGFYESGVDAEKSVLNRYKNYPYANETYRAIWRLDITVDDNGEVTLDLYECSR